MTTARLTDRKLGFAFAVLFLVILAIGYLVFGAVLTWALWTSGTFALLALIVPQALLPLNVLWHGLAHRIGWFNNHLILGIFYFFVLVPFGMVLKVFGRDPMQRTLGRETESYWTPVTRHADADTFQDMF